MKKKVYLVIIILLVVIAGWFIFAGQTGNEGKVLEWETVNTKSSQEILQGLGVPVEEILVDYSRFDTNNDGKIETLVITEDPVGARTHYYILDQLGNKVYEKTNVLISPERIELRNYEDDKYKSFFLVFKQQHKEGYFIRWNVEEYEIPGEEKE